MKLPAADWQHAEGMAQLLEALGAAEGESRYVGGAVRDSLLGLAVSDVDLATRIPPKEVMGRLKRAGIKAVPTGIEHGTVTAVLRGGPVEVTTLRRDVSTDGRRATIAYTDDWQADASRRDFTLNALYADPVSGKIFDFFDGVADLEARRVRFIGDPLTRIAEDHLRILRFFRFHARFGGGAPDSEGLAACSARANDLMALSRERIADEILKLLALPDPAATAALMIVQGIFSPVLPKIDHGAGDRLARLVLREAEAGIPGDRLRRLSALLPANAEAATAVGKRLRLSNKAVKRLGIAAGWSDGISEDARAMAHAIGVEGAVDRMLLGDADAKSIASIAGWEPPHFPLKGSDLIAMGLEAGPLVAKTLQAAEKAWVSAGFPSDDDAVRAIARGAFDQALQARQ